MRRIAVLRYLVTHAGAQLEFSPITQLGVEFYFDDIQDVSEIAPMIRQIAGGIFDQADAQIADREGAPGGLPRLAGMHGRGNAGPVRHRERQRRDFHLVTPGSATWTRRIWSGPNRSRPRRAGHRLLRARRSRPRTA